MGGKNKSKQESSTTNTYGFMTPPSTPDVDAVRDWTPQIDPGISYSYARAKNALRNSFDNPLGADTPQAVKDAMLFQGEQDLGQQEAQTLREASNDVNDQELRKKLAVAGFTEPKLVQTSGLTSGTTSQGGGFGSALGGLATVGLAL